MIGLRRRLMWGVVALIALSASPRAWAGHPQERHGFWIGFGVGYGSAGLDCDDCGSEREDSFTGLFKIGGTLNPHVLLGAESNAWIKEDGSVTLTLGSITGTVTVYPKASAGFFLKAGVGASYFSTEDRFEDATVTLDKWGWGLLAGAGYDLRVGRNVSITPSVSYYFGHPGDVGFGGDADLLGLKQDVVDFTIGVTFH